MDVKNSTPNRELYALATPHLFIAVLNRSRDVIVRVAINWPLENLAWQGRRNHILLSWDDTRVFDQRSQADLKVVHESCVFVRDVLLPCDVDFSNAFWFSTTSHLIMRFPKLFQEIRTGQIPYSPVDERWVAVEVSGQLVEDRE